MTSYTAYVYRAANLCLDEHLLNVKPQDLSKGFQTKEQCSKGSKSTKFLALTRLSCFYSKNCSLELECGLIVEATVRERIPADDPNGHLLNLPLSQNRAIFLPVAESVTCGAIKRAGTAFR